MEFHKRNLLKGLKDMISIFTSIVCFENKQMYTLKLLLIVLNIACTIFIFWTMCGVGLSLIKSHGGVIYFIAFIDDFSCKVWVYFMRHKYEASTKFGVEGRSRDSNREKGQIFAV